MTQRLAQRGQTLVLMALAMVLVVVMACMTLSISNRVRKKLELQTTADTAAYNNAVATARAMNSMGMINRTVVSHWVVMLGVEANVAWGSTVPAYFDAFAFELNELSKVDACPALADETRRQNQLVEARNAFLHASLSLWSGFGHAKDPVTIYGCPGGACFNRLRPGLASLDAEAAQQSKDVWRSVRDLVEVQRDLEKELREVLEAQSLATQSALASQGRSPGSSSTFPLRVEQGVGPLENDPRPPGWREVSGALGTSSDALAPIAHAAMGSRGSRFVQSNKWMDDKGSFHTYTPLRAIRYTARLQALLNSKYATGSCASKKTMAKGCFRFHVQGGLATTFLTDGDVPDPDADDAADQDEDLDGEDPGIGQDELPDPAPPPPLPDKYNPRATMRITPERAIGFKYASSRHAGKIGLAYHSPCGGQSAYRTVTASARSHTEMSTQAWSQHEWSVGEPHFSEEHTPDGTRTFTLVKPQPLHGVSPGTDMGWDLVGHTPATMCHPTHGHWGEGNDSDHTLAKEIEGKGLAPGGFGYVFPQNGNDPLDKSKDRDGASGAFGQPKTPVLLTQANSGGGLPIDPWNLSFKLRFTNNGAGTGIDLAKASDQTPMAALSTGIAYYHRRCARYTPTATLDGDGKSIACQSWNESPNLLNPFWRATLVPIDIDETPAGKGSDDLTPGGRLVNQARPMLRGAGLDEAARAYVLLKQKGYEGIQ